MKNVYVMTLPRSGSTYLFKTMIQSPDIAHSYKEPFNPEYFKSETDLDVFNSYRIFIDKIKTQQGVLIKDTLNYVDMLKEGFDSKYDFRSLFLEFQDIINQNFYKIKIYRRNIFDQALSNCIAVLTDKWITFNDETRFPVITVDIDYFKSMLDDHKNYRSFLLNYQHYDKIIWYEDILNYAKSYQEWPFSFLTPPAEYKPVPTVPNPPKYRIVINFNELLEWYEKHKHIYEIDYDN